MTKNIIITALAVISALSLYTLDKTTKERDALSISPKIWSIDWPEELGPLLEGGQRINHKMSFELVDHTMIVGFDNSGRIARAEKD